MAEAELPAMQAAPECKLLAYRAGLVKWLAWMFFALAVLIAVFIRLL